MTHDPHFVIAAESKSASALVYVAGLLSVVFNVFKGQ